MKEKRKSKRNKFQKSIVLFLCFIFLYGSKGWGATYYIDYISGNDLNGGQSTPTPFKHCPGDLRASGSANIILSPGDVVVFKGGVTYAFSNSETDFIAANSSGSDGSPITYISGHLHSTPWPNPADRAIIDGTDADLDYGAGRNGVISLKGYSYITVRGLEIKNMPIVGNAAGSIGLIGWKATTGGNIVIDDNVIHNSGGNGVVIQGSYSGSTYPTGFIIQNNNIYMTNVHGLMLRFGLDNVLVYNNSFDLNGVEVYDSTDAYRVGDNISLTYDVIGGGGGVDTNIVIRGNDFNDTSKEAGYIPSKGHILLQQDTIGTIIENNYFHGEPRVASTLTVGNQKNLTIRNNVFHVFPTAFQGIIRFYSGQNYADIDGTKIYNNTIVSRPYGGVNNGAIFFGALADPDVQYTNVDIRNNIIDTDTETDKDILLVNIGNTKDGSDKPVVELSTLTINYNVYHSANLTGDYFYAQDNVSNPAMTFSEWKTYLSDVGALGADTQSLWGSVIFRDKPGKDFRLSINDVSAKDNGVDLSSKGFSRDKVGILRPKGLKWDIGAHELYPGPTNFKRIP